MSDDFDRYEDEEFEPSSRIPRRSGGVAVDLTGVGIRLAATVVVIGLGILIIYFALRPEPDEVAAPIPTAESEVVSEEAFEAPLATFTPGATSTPPPLDEPTPAPTVEAAQAGSGAVTIGASAVVTGTNGFGVNLRQESNTTSPILQILADSTPLSVVEGPVENESYVWWKVRLEDGTEGWVVQEFLAP